MIPMFLGWTACTETTLPEGHDDEATIVDVTLDDTAALGFSAAQVLAATPSGRFTAADLPSDADYADDLVASGPFTITMQVASATAAVRTEADDAAAPTLWVRVPVDIASDDGAFATTGTLDLAARSLDAITWTAWSTPLGAVGTVPSWVDDLVEAGALCPEGAAVSAEQARPLLILDGPVDAPVLSVQLEWHADGECQSIGVIDAVQLTAE